jgi:hypothetical protein
LDCSNSATRIRRRIDARLIAIGLFICAALPCEAEPRFSFAATPGPLPKNVVPAAYRIDLAPDLAQRKFSGREAIDVDVTRPTDVVTLNAVELQFERVALAGEDAAVARVSIDAAHCRRGSAITERQLPQAR